MTLYLTGLHSGTNPQPGLGSARSLRAAFPKAHIVGVDYSPRSSGIHWPELDQIWLQRPWDEMHLPSYADRVRGVLDAGGCWLSGTDLESRWLAGQFPDAHPRLLSPSMAALQSIEKPGVPAAAAALPVRIAPYRHTAATSDWDLHAFCRAHDWNLWLKGPYYDAVRVTNWPALEAGRRFLTGLWTTEDLFVQKHVAGFEESVCFAAYEGELLGAVRMVKRDLTDLSKTWAGSITEVPESFLQPLRAVLRDLRYTGGGELEMIRDADEVLWLLEWNPRFPAWIYGATLAGTNMPALLVARALGLDAPATPVQARAFTRVVLEVPVNADHPLPPLPEPLPVTGFGLKHPSGLLGLAKNMHSTALAADTAVSTPPPLPAVPASYLTDLEAAQASEHPTPQFIFLPTVAEAGFRRTAAAAQALSGPGLTVLPAYSIKTNPDARLLQCARQAGLLAEAISLAEVRKALQCGFPAGDILLNGPGKWYPDSTFPEAPLRVVFADSLADLERIAAGVRSGAVKAASVGIRLRPPHITSRFGIPTDHPEAFSALVRAIAGLPESMPLSAHMHMASSTIGVERWLRLFQSTLHWCGAVQAMTGRAFASLDLGGGWAPDDWTTFLTNGLPQAVAAVRAQLPDVKELFLEPGKALAEPAMALAMRILEIKEDREGGRTEVVVDGSVADLPMGQFQPHRILHRSAGGQSPLQVLGRGTTQLQGRLCMEHDFAALSVGLPETAAPGDELYVCDAGAYDKSMSYDFGKG